MALPSDRRAGAPADPRSVFGLPENATLADARRAFRRLARQTHPDHGGDSDAFVAVVAAFASLRQVLAAGVGEAPGTLAPTAGIRRPSPYDWTLRPAPPLPAAVVAARVAARRCSPSHLGGRYRPRPTFSAVLRTEINRQAAVQPA